MIKKVKKVKKIKEVKEIKKIIISLYFTTILFIFFMVKPYADNINSSIIAFGLSSNPFINKNNKSSNIQICYLDNYDNHLQKINKEIYGRYYIDYEGLTNKYQSRFKAISDSYLCRYRAKLLGIKELPAIVFNKGNQKYVIYGEQDIKKTIEEYQAYKERTND